MNIFVNPDEDRFRAGWRLAAQLFLMYLIGLSLLWIISRFIPITGPLLPTAAIATGAIASIIMAGRGMDQRMQLNFGLTFTRRSYRQYALGFGAGALAMGVIFLIEYAAGWLRVTGFGWNYAAGNSSFLYAIGTFFVFMVIVGVYEELIFRGYQIVNLSEGLNGPVQKREQAVISAVVLSSLIFGMMHALNPNASIISTINVALAGGMLAFPFIITGRLSISIGLHIGWNFFQGGVFGFPVSGQPARVSLLHIQQRGSVFITGGGFGPEAGLMGLIGISLIVAGLAVFFHKSGRPIAIHHRLGVYQPLPFR